MYFLYMPLASLFPVPEPNLLFPAALHRKMLQAIRKKTKELLKTGLIFTFVLSCILTIFLQHNAHMTAISFLHDSRCEELLILLSYTFPFASIHSCICGYSLGLKQTKIPAVSQLFEQTFRILFVFLFCYYRTSHQLDLSISFAVVGLAMGEIFASCYCLYSIHHTASKQVQNLLSASTFCIHLSRLFRHAFPLTASRVLLNILQSIEAVSIPVFLQYSGMSSSLSLQVYGVLTGMALPCILFPSAITNAVSSMLLPTVAEIQEMKEKRRLQAIISKIACSCIFLGCFCCIFLLISGKWIGIFLFKSPLAGSFILTLSWICPFLYTNTVLLGIINGLGKTTFSFIINFLSLCIRIAGVCLFIPIWGINGYLTGLLISQIFFVFVLYTSSRNLHKRIFHKKDRHTVCLKHFILCVDLYRHTFVRSCQWQVLLDHLQCFQKHSDNDRIHITFCYHSQQHQHYQFYSFSGIPPDHRIFQHIFKQ